MNRVPLKKSFRAEGRFDWLPTGANRPSARSEHEIEDRRSRPSVGGGGEGGAGTGQGGKGAERANLDAVPSSEEVGPRGGGGKSSPRVGERSERGWGWGGPVRVGAPGGGSATRLSAAAEAP